MAKSHIIVNTDELHYYLKDLKKIPVITHIRQEEIFKALLDPEVTKLVKDKLKSDRSFVYIERDRTNDYFRLQNDKVRKFPNDYSERLPERSPHRTYETLTPLGS